MNSTDIDGVRNSNENINIGEILSKVDHTLLSPVATWEEIKKLCDEGAAYGVASVCIPASYVSQARDYIGNQVKICTVAGFPNGYATAAGKWVGAEGAVKNGAETIPGKVVSKNGVQDITLYVKGLTNDEKTIILEGCLINYYAAGYGKD